MKYEDIINLPHYEFKNHVRMSIENRSAQFAPFAALTGYSESIKETERLTDKKIEISEDVKCDIDMKLQLIENNIKSKPFISVLYFKKDNKKPGGEYIEYEGNIRRIDLINKCIIFTSNKKIELDNIYDIECKILNL